MSAVRLSHSDIAGQTGRPREYLRHSNSAEPSVQKGAGIRGGIAVPGALTGRTERSFLRFGDIDPLWPTGVRQARHADPTVPYVTACRAREAHRIGGRRARPEVAGNVPNSQAPEAIWFERVRERVIRDCPESDGSGRYSIVIGVSGAAIRSELAGP